MTVAQLRKQMDSRFDAVDTRFEAVDKRFESVETRLEAIDARMRAGFESLHAKLNGMFHGLDRKSDHHQIIVELYEQRLKDLEAGGRAI